MNTDPAAELSILLRRAQAGDSAARSALLTSLYDRLRRAAKQKMNNERLDHSLEATDLVHEVMLRVDESLIRTAGDQRHFFNILTKAMKNVLVDCARRRRAAKRGGDGRRQPLDPLLEEYEQTHNFEFLELMDLLDRLEAESPRCREIIELRMFCGLTIAETAELLECGTTTVEDDTRLGLARMRLWMADAC